MYKVSWTSSKVIYSVGGAILSFTQSIHSAMIGLLICMAIDTLTGFIAAPYRGELRESAKLSRFVTKIITYFASAITLHVAEIFILPTYVAGTLELSRMAMTLFATLEIYSVLENLRDITGLRAFNILTLNFKKKLEDSTGLTIPRPTKQKKHK